MLRLLLIFLIWVLIFAVNPLVAVLLVPVAIVVGVVWLAWKVVRLLLGALWQVLTLPFRAVAYAAGCRRPRYVMMSARCG